MIAQHEEKDIRYLTLRNRVTGDFHVRFCKNPG